MHQPNDSVIVLTGSRGGGKSSWLQPYMRGFGRAVVWSPLEETDRYAARLGVTPTEKLVDFYRAMQERPRYVVFAPDDPTEAQFQFFCKVIWKDRRRWKNSLVLVEELVDVTTISKARGWWGQLLRKGRHHGLNIAATTQRPQEIDKTIMDNATRLVCFRQGRRVSREWVADELDIDIASVNDLKPLDFFDKNLLTGAIEKGRIAFR